MNKKLYQIGLTLCGLCLTVFSGAFSSFVSIVFFGEPEYPTQE